jgi:hypothetical protein
MLAKMSPILSPARQSVVVLTIVPEVPAVPPVPVVDVVPDVTAVDVTVGAQATESS